MDIAVEFCSNWMSDSHLNLQTSIFLWISGTAVTLGQGHREVQYISPVHTFFALDILSWAETVLMWEAKVVAAEVKTATAETNWNHEITPDRGDLNNKTDVGTPKNPRPP